MSARCIAIRPPSKDACGKLATHVATFHDGTKGPCCQECAVHLQNTADSMRAPISIRKMKTT